MIFKDLITMPFGNLWRIKLRSALTMSGVMIAIGAFVAMLSFGAGNQQYINEQWEKLGLFSTMHVYELRDSDLNKDSEESDESDKSEDSTSSDSTIASDTAQTVDSTVTSLKIKRVLNDSAVVELSAIPGVELAYPFASFDVKVKYNDSTISTDAQALPIAATKTKMFSDLKNGRMFSSDSAKEVVVTMRFLEEYDIDSSATLIGKQIIISVERLRLDSAVASLVESSSDMIRQYANFSTIDSLKDRTFLKRVGERELSNAVNSFSDGFFNSPAIISDTLTITGVLSSGMGGSRIRPILMPMETAKRFNAAGMSSDPTELLSMIKTGSVDFSTTPKLSKDYSRVTLQIDRHTPYQKIKDSVKALGFRSFSFAEEFEEISQVFLYFDFALALIGLIALATASLGIANTMIMSISERRKEIGVLKSLGASSRDIKILFLFESALIGTIGSLAGILLGWTVTRIGSAIAQYYMVENGMDPIDLFTLPWWLVVISLAFGLLISVLAGIFPASRAAKVDPMEALRAG